MDSSPVLVSLLPLNTQNVQNAVSEQVQWSSMGANHRFYLHTAYLPFSPTTAPGNLKPDRKPLVSMINLFAHPSSDIHVPLASMFNDEFKPLMNTMADTEDAFIERVEVLQLKAYNRWMCVWARALV